MKMKILDVVAVANRCGSYKKSIFSSFRSRLPLLLIISHFFAACQAASIAQEPELTVSESGGIMNSFWNMFGVTPGTEQLRSADDVSLQLSENIVDDLSTTASAMEPSSDLYQDYDWLSSYTDTSVAGTATDVTNWSPYGLLSTLNGDEGAEIAGDLYQLYMDPDSMSYLQMMSTYVKIMLFFMPAIGIVQQTYFALAMARVTMKAATMYYGGYSTTEIALTLLPDITSAALVDGARRRRDESFLTPPLIMQPMEMATAAIPLESFSSDDLADDIPSLMAYVDSINFPPLPEGAEEEIYSDVSRVVDEYFSNLPAETNRQSLVNSLVHTVKFFSLLQLLDGGNLVKVSSESDE